MSGDTVSQQFFEAKYRENSDPWNFATSNYEQNRYDITVNAIQGRRFRRAFEPGCSVGILTARLAMICDEVEAWDISPTAVVAARERCQSDLNVNFQCRQLPNFLPNGSFDLIVFSEIGYYFDKDQLETLGQGLVSKLTKGGSLIAVHWLGSSDDHLIGGDQVHEILGVVDGLVNCHSERHPGFRLDRWVRL